MQPAGRSKNFEIQGGRVDKNNPAKIVWGNPEGGRFFPLSEAKFSADVAWGLGGRARIVAASYLPQSILDKAPGDKVDSQIECVVRLKRGPGNLGPRPLSRRHARSQAPPCSS